MARIATVSSPRRKARLVLGAALAAALLSACGGRFVPPSAVVDGRKISESSLERALDLLFTDPQFAQQASGPEGEATKKDLTRQELGFLIRRELAAEYADAHGIVVSAQDIDKALQDTVSGLGGQDVFDQVVKARGLSTADVRDILSQQVLLQKVQDAVVAERLGSSAAGADEQTRNDEFNRWLTDRLLHADIVVNPRFGRFDPGSGEVSAVTSTAG